MDILNLIKEYNLKVMPSLAHGENTWFAGQIQLCNNGTGNCQPYHLLARGNSLEEAVLKAVELVEGG